MHQKVKKHFMVLCRYFEEATLHLLLSCRLRIIFRFTLLLIASTLIYIMAINRFSIMHRKLTDDAFQPKIAAIIHQTFAADQALNAHRSYIKSCIELNPDWQYYMWTDDAIEAFIKDNYAFFLPRYLAYKSQDQRRQSARYMILHHFGGIFIDMDVQCMRPFFPSLEELTAFVAQENTMMLPFERAAAINSVMGSVSGHPFFLRLVFEMIEVDDKEEGTLSTSGHFMLTKALRNWWLSEFTSCFQVTLLSPELLKPIVRNNANNFKRPCKELGKSAPGQTPPDQSVDETELCTNNTDHGLEKKLVRFETTKRHIEERKRQQIYFKIHKVAQNVNLLV